MVICNSIIVKVCEVRRQSSRPQPKWEENIKWLLNKKVKVMAGVVGINTETTMDCCKNGHESLGSPEDEGIDHLSNCYVLK
jgi:hypothetical protein